jgi:metacaspase-1
MTKYALCIGINYQGQDGELNGCINDALHLQKMLTEVYHYPHENITLLTDETQNKPTVDNIIQELYNLVLRCYRENVEEIWFSYSGHGSYIHDTSGDEDDNRDECLVPLDYAQKGMLSDDILHHVLSYFPSSTKLICLIDACHSGTMLDLPYRYLYGHKSVEENENSKVKGDVVMISGCRDTQTSADAWNVANREKYTGAMTSSFLHVLKEFNHDITCYNLIKHMRRFLSEKGFEQTPQISCTKKLSNTSIFSRNGELNSYLKT